MEDVEQAMFAHATSTACSTPSPSYHDSAVDTPRSSGDSRPVKKRKSWGQVLPEPKTNLPPRKRAKTADEKEQRRIERVKRNRLAAHNSRERKRQEVDALQAEKAALEQRVKDMETELLQYRQLLPTANIPKAPELQVNHHFALLDAYNEEHDYDHELSNQVAPSQGSFNSPDSLLSTMDSPVDTAPPTPRIEMTAREPDATQHSAVSVGYPQLPHFDTKFSGSAEYHHPLQRQDLPDDGSFDTMFDFKLFPDTSIGIGNTDSFFDSSFDSTSAQGLHSSTNDFLDFSDEHSIFDLQPGAGATITVSDASGIAS